MDGNWTVLAHRLQSVSMREVSSNVWLLPFGLLVLAIVTVPVHILDDKGLPRYRSLRAQLARVDANNDKLEREVEQLRRQVERLREDPQAIERIARDELGMVRPGELIFQFPQ